MQCKIFIKENESLFKWTLVTISILFGNIKMGDNLKMRMDKEYEI